MTVRRALLIGVPHYDDPTFSVITHAVRIDLRRMREALEPSGYVVTALGEDDRLVSGNRIRDAITTACDDAPPKSTLLLYFSGHGVSIDGRDYLVPGDAYRRKGFPAPEVSSLIPLLQDLRGCDASLVVLFADACRDAPAGPSDAAHGGILFPGSGAAVIVTGCAPGQKCSYGEEGSFFTQALARALDRRSPVRQLSAVLSEVGAELRRNSSAHQIPNAFPKAVLATAGLHEICDGDELLSAWRRAAEQSALWRLASNVPSDTIAEVLAIVEHCARAHNKAIDYLMLRTGMKDHWFDSEYPARVNTIAATLLRDRVPLAPEQAALLISAPFLREAIIAEGITLAADLRPNEFKRSYETGERTDLELTHEMYPQVGRRAEGLYRRDQKESADTLALWLVYRWLAGLGSLWDSQAGKALFDRCKDLVATPAAELSRGERCRLVETLARAVGAGPIDATLERRLEKSTLPDDWRGLSGVLWVAGILGSDPRRMPAVIADHIGTGLELPLSSVRNAANRLHIKTHKGNLDVTLICEHPAQQAAFTEVAEDAQLILERLPRLGSTGSVSNALPDRITHEGIRPDQPSADGAPAYQVPLTRFQISEDKVRELLMGRQLYDDPSLAIRELYQNALDACRYRDTRLEGLRRNGQRPAPWAGKIVFYHGFEGNREYIECEDNGVGMGRDILENVFANAGERFVYLAEYRAEHANWQNLNPPLSLVPNSQFGVGVFSYFMIADEVRLDTRKVELNGIPSGNGFTVRISSSGSLIQVTPSQEMLGGGTRVRLYLTGDEDDRISVLGTLRRLLWVAEYQVVAAEDGSKPEVWHSRELRYQDESAESLRTDRDLWWVSGEGGLAADGLRTDKEIVGLVVNLRDQRRPQFTVDRKKLRTWDEDWVNKKIDESLPQLMDWPGLSLSWLWDVAESNPEVAKRVFSYLVKSGKDIPVSGAWGQGRLASPVDKGCLPLDKELFDPQNWNVSHARWFAVWRRGVWHDTAKGGRGLIRVARAEITSGFPTPDPIDGSLIGRLNREHWDGTVPIDSILRAIAHPERPVGELLNRLRKFAITGLGLGELRRCPPISRVFKEKDAPLLRAFAAWTPPGQTAPAVVAGWLIKTSVDLDLPLSEVLRRIEELAPVGWEAPPLDLGSLGDRICTVAESKLVSNFLGGPPWVEGDLQPDHIVYASGELGRDVGQILKMCDQLAPLGVTVAGRDLYPESLNDVAVEALRYVSRCGDSLNPIALVLVAGSAGLSVQEARSKLTDLDRSGLLKLPDLPEVSDLKPGPEILAFINGTSMRVLWSNRRPTFTKWGSWLSITAGMTGRYYRRGVSDLEELLPYGRPRESIENFHLVRLASMIYGTIGDARRAFLQAYPDISLPAPIAGCEELNPWLDSDYLVTPLNSWQRPNWTVGVGEIVGGAFDLGLSVGAFLTHLDPYRALGAPLPSLSEDEITLVGDWHPELKDLEMINQLNDYMTEAETHRREINALNLIQIAGRLGMVLREAHLRLSRMVPLGLRLDYPTVEFHEEVVRWQDLLVLTAYCDGQAPALSGAVDSKHLEWASELTGETVEWIAERLKVYSKLFELSLPEEITGG